MDISLQTEISQVRVIDEKRNYWFIRTYGGRLFDYFRENNFIGLGFNNVPFAYIKEAKPITETINGVETSVIDLATFTRLQKFISDNTSYKKGEATKWANQLIDFEHEIKVGDLVIIPSEKSDYLLFGIVEGETHLVDDKLTFQFNDKFEPYPQKRRTVKWLKLLPKGEFRGSLNAMFSSHSAVKRVNNYSEIIEGNLSSLYIKDEHVYLYIKIDQEEEINAFELQRFLESLTYLYKEFCIDQGIEDNEDLYIKIKVQSRGGMYLRALGIGALVSIGAIIHLAHDPQVLKDLEHYYDVTGLVGVAAMILLSDNSKLKLDIEGLGKIEGSSSGLLKSISNFLESRRERAEKKADKEHERKVELLKLFKSIEELKVKSIDNPVTKEQDEIENRKKNNS